MIPEDGRLTNEEILSCYEGKEPPTQEQMDIFNDFVALAAVIAYEGLLQENRGITN